MIPLSPRLLCCASMVKGDYVCDIGTDHALLPVWLVTTGKCSRALATDSREGPLRAARATVERYHAGQDVTLLLSDGFRKIPKKGITDVVIAGLGGETIRDMLSDASAAWLSSGVNLVLQPMTKAPVLRDFLARKGFTVTKETAVRDNHVTAVMQARYTGQTRELTEVEAHVGALNRSEQLTRIYIADVLRNLHTKAHGLEDAGSDSAPVRALIQGINLWLNPGAAP